MNNYPGKAFLAHLTESLESRNFRLYFGGMSLSLIGTWMQQIAMSWLVFEMTGSLISLATITFLAQIPILITTPFLSLLVDRYDRRRILIFTQTMSAIQASILAWLTLTDRVEVWHLMALSLLIGLINSLDNPTRQAFYPSLVEKRLLSNAIALNSAVINGSRLIGPAVGGIIIAGIGCGLCFLINAVSYFAVIASLMLMRNTPSPINKTHEAAGKSLIEGWNYICNNIPIRTLLLLMAGVSTFALPLMTFIPAYAKTILLGDSQTLGTLLSLTGVGSFAAAIYLAARRSVQGLEKVIGYTTVILAIGILLLSIIRFHFLAYVACVVIGFTMITTVAAINTLLQSISDEHMRGRVMGYMAMTFTGVSPIGGMFLATLEHYLTLQQILITGGTITLLISAIYAIYRHHSAAFVIQLPR
ncbi:MAG: MFS transporter [Marinifilaceae bacterium]